MTVVVNVYVPGCKIFDFNLSTTVEQLDVTSALPCAVPDMQWFALDKAGHFHAFADDGTLPTLDEEQVVVPCDGTSCGNWADECEGTTKTVYRCKICKKKVKPQWTTSVDTFRKTAPGRRTTEIEFKVTGPVPFVHGDLLSFRVDYPEAHAFGIAQVINLQGELSTVVTSWRVVAQVTSMGTHKGRLAVTR
jgi:hypothetical protein